MSSRDKILGKLKEGRNKFPGIMKPGSYQPMVPVNNRSQSAILSLFIEQALKANCVVHQAETAEETLKIILRLIGEDSSISCWDPAYIPIPGLTEALVDAGITRVGQAADVRLGLTGVDAALAATGSIVVLSGEGQFRATSLLPPVHVAVVAVNQILPDLESWWAKQKKAGLEHIRQHSNVVVITGPSRTADIAMELVMGMHGPRELHILLIK